MNDLLLDGLDALVPEPRENGDWSDVVVRAGAARPGRRRLVVAAVAVALVVVVAAPALAYVLGWIGRQDVPYSQTRPAPNAVKKQFAEIEIGAPEGMSPGVMAGRLARSAATARAGSCARSGSPRPSAAASVTSGRRSWAAACLRPPNGGRSR